MKLVKNSQGVKPLHHKGFKVRLRLVTRTLGFRLAAGRGALTHCGARQWLSLRAINQTLMVFCGESSSSVYGRCS